MIMTIIPRLHKAAAPWNNVYILSFAAIPPRRIYSGRDSSELRRSWTARSCASRMREEMPRERILNFLNWSAAIRSCGRARLYSLSWRVTSLSSRCSTYRNNSCDSPPRKCGENLRPRREREPSEIRSTRGLEFVEVKWIARKNENFRRGFKKRMTCELGNPFTEWKCLILYIIEQWEMLIS